jgi:hypothetical protein
VRIYRLSLHLYPRQFRREYSDDMVALLEEQLRDESAARVVGRAVLDLLVTVPTRHLEARMHRSATIPLVVTFAAVAAALTVFGGPMGLLGGVAFLGLAALIWQRSRPVVVVQSSRWWKLLLGGVALLATLIVVTTITGELPSGGWYIAMATMFTSFGLIGAGVVLGIAGRMRSVPEA